MNILNVLHGDAEQIVSSIRKAPLSPIGYDYKGVGWVLELSAKKPGWHAFTPMYTESEKGFRNLPKMLIPSADRSINILPIPCADFPSYTLGRYVNDSSLSEAENVKKALRAVKQHEAYVLEMGSIADKAQDAAFATAYEAVRLGHIVAPEAMRLERILIRVDGVYLHESEAFRAYWNALIHESKNSGREGICQLAREKRVLARMLPSINLADTKARMDSKMYLCSSIGATHSSTESWGQTQSESACVSYEEYLKFHQAFTALISSDQHSYMEPGLVCIFWCKETYMPLMFANPPLDIKKVKDFIEDVYKGKITSSQGLTGYETVSCFVLGRNTSRLVVRSQSRQTLSEMLRRQAQWLEAIGADKKRSEDEYLRKKQMLPLTLYEMANSLYKDSKQIPMKVRDSLLRTAIYGQPLPEFILHLAVNAYRSARHNAASQIRDSHRIALMRCYLTRHLTQERKNIMEATSIEESKAYHLGRLFQELESLQNRAVNPNKSLSDSFFRLASTYPQTSFVNLLQMSRHHIDKLRSSADPRAAKTGYYIDEQISALMSVIGEIPERLSIQEQAQFMVGYYSARNEMFERISKSRADKSASSDNIYTEEDTQASEATIHA